MRVRLFVWTAAMAMLLATGAAAPAHGLASGVVGCNVHAHGRYPGHPPRFGVPRGGSEVDHVNGAGNKVCVIRWRNGRLARVAIETSTGVVFHEAYYNTDGQEFTAIDGELAESVAPSQASRSATSHPRRPGHLQPYSFTVCDDAEAQSSYKWGSELPVKWWTITTSHLKIDPVPSYLDQALTLSNERAAHTEWTSNDNVCGVPDNTAFTTAYQGVDNDCPTFCWANDGKSRLMWGNLEDWGFNSNWLAVTQTWYDQNLGTIIEADIMMDTDGASTSNSKPWVNGLVSGRFDVWSVVAHEVGHLAGFEHVNSSYNVMKPGTSPDNIDQRQLGEGDARENNKKY